MEIITFKISGLSPLLQHNPRSMLSSGSDGLKTKKRYDPQDEAEAGVYRDGNEQIVIPSIAFRSAIMSASKGRKIGKTAARSVISGCVFPVEEFCQLIDKRNKPLKRYEIHSCRAVVQRAGIIRHRPKFNEWGCLLALEVDTEMLPDISIVQELLNIAGKIIGVGDWRPEKLGTFGRFYAEILN